MENNLPLPLRNLLIFDFDTTFPVNAHLSMVHRIYAMIIIEFPLEILKVGSSVKRSVHLFEHSHVVIRAEFW